MECTDKEWKHCNVEKMGCEGCFYNDYEENIKTSEKTVKGVKSMNDIEVLEDFKNNKIQRDKLEIDQRCGSWKMGHIYKSLELNTAIENLLKERQSDKERIKDLKEINEAHKKENGELRERVNKQSLLKEKIIALLKGE